MPDKSKEREEGDKHLCKAISVELVPKFTMKVVPHTFLNVKNFLLYQIQHEYILSQQEAMPKLTNLIFLLNDTEVKVTALLANGTGEKIKH